MIAQEETREFWLTSDFINQLCSESSKEDVTFQAHGREEKKKKTKKINQLSRQEENRKRETKKMHGK